MKLPPWMFIVFAWIGLLSAIVVTVKICRNNTPEEVALDKPVEAASRAR